MFSKKIRLNNKGKTVSVATSLVLMAIEDLSEDPSNNSDLVYGYQIMIHLKESYQWDVKSGTVYPILKKLEKELLIKKGIAKKQNRDTKRQMIFYKISQKGKKLTAKIKSLNSEALETALTINEENSISLDLDEKKRKFPIFDPNNFAENYIAPILLDFDNLIAERIYSTKDLEKLDILEAEIEKSIKQLEIGGSLLQGQITRIKSLKKLKKKDN